MMLRDDIHVDGNAMGGWLMDALEVDLTSADGCCVQCGAINPVGAVLVYEAGPGNVMRCPACSAVLMVATSLPAGPRLWFVGLRWLAPPREPR